MKDQTIAFAVSEASFSFVNHDVSGLLHFQTIPSDYLKRISKGTK